MLIEFTPSGGSEGVIFLTIKEMSDLERENKEAIEGITLNEEEVIDAIKEAKIKKYFHVKHKEYWDAQEKKGNAKTIADIIPLWK